MQRITVKQEKFVQGLVKGLSQREAYKRSYSTKNMKDRTIDVKASELLKNGKVSARFDEINGKVVKKAEEKTIATAVEVLEFYSDLMRGIKKDVAILPNVLGQMEEREVKATLRERVKGADALAKRYGIDKIIEKEEKEELIVKWE